MKKKKKNKKKKQQKKMKKKKKKKKKQKQEKETPCRQKYTHRPHLEGKPHLLRRWDSRLADHGSERARTNGPTANSIFRRLAGLSCTLCAATSAWR